MMLSLYVLLNLAVLWIVARASAASGWQLVLMLFALGFVVGSANSLVEAAVFGVLAPSQTMAAAVPAAIVFAVLSPLAVFLAGRWKVAGETPEQPGAFTPATLIGAVLVYELLYWSAGTLVWPYIAHFYATKSVPPVYAVASLQIVRSLIFVGVAYPLLKIGLRPAPLVLALVYSVIGGVAPLLPDNPFMPPDIRFYHAIETSTSNFIFGLAVGFLFNFRAQRLAQA